jgi:hypothetical protein
MIPMEDNCDFLRRNRDLEGSISWQTGTSKFVPVNHAFGTTRTHDAVKKVESDEYE